MSDDFLHVTAGDLMQIFTVIGAIGMTIFTVGRRVANMEKSSEDLSDKVDEIKGDVKKLGDIVTQIAVQKERLDMFDRRLDDYLRGRVRLLPNRGHE